MALAIAAALGAAVWTAAPGFVEDPLPGVLARTPVRVWRDRNGEALYCERTWRHEWRFDVPLTNIAPDVVALMLNTEDARFFRHRGVDYLAILRAAWQNLASGKVVSGASTISMQVAAMDGHRGRRSFSQKFLQAAKARKMERLHSKGEILEAYFNNIPYGGKLYGIEAAARYYFGMSAHDLTAVEASVLCGIPQLPNRFRPDRHPEAARRRQRRVLDCLVRAGKMTRQEADRIFLEERLRYRDFAIPADFEALGQAREWTFLIEEGHPFRPGDAQDERLSVDAHLSRRIADGLARRAKALRNVRDAAAMLLDAPSGETLAYVGTLDFGSAAGGQVDAAAALRSAGSALKPFLYYEAIRGGHIVADSILLDAPVRFADYAPGNYASTFLGRVRADEALSLSLNTPVVRLLAELGARRMADRLDALGLDAPGRSGTNGLSLALGTAGYRLADMTRAYRTLVPGLADDVEEGARLMLADMLRTRPMPGTQHPVAWKTGTSNNNCDAWCFAYTPDYVLGVWFGNKDGRRSSSLVGAEVAAPAAGEIFEMLYARARPTAWPDPAGKIRTAGLCAKTGRAASSACAETTRGRVLASIPLRVCTACQTAARHATILSPTPRTYLRAPGEADVTLPLEADTPNVLWLVDGCPLERGAAKFAFPPGRHSVTAVPFDLQGACAQVTVIVL